MAQFDVYRVTGGTLAVDCQADLLNDLPTRVVAPLVRDQASAFRRLTPQLSVNGEKLTMLTPLLRGISAREIEEVIGSIVDQEYVVKTALDMLISGF